MKQNQEQTLIKRAKNWIIRLYIQRTDKEQEAYLQGVQDALMAIYEDTMHGAYPASRMYGVLDNMFAEYFDGKNIANYKP